MVVWGPWDRLNMNYLHLNDRLRVANLPTVADGQRIIADLQIKVLKVDLDNLWEG